MWNGTNTRWFMLKYKSSLRGRVWGGKCWQSCVEQQSKSLLHKATVEAGPALESELLRKETNKVSLWLSQCQIWLGNAGNGDGARRIFSALCQLNKELCGLLARVEACTNFQPKSVSGHKLNGLNQALIPLFLDCAAHEGRAEPKGEMGHGYCDHESLARFVLFKGDYWWQSWLYW